MEKIITPMLGSGITTCMSGIPYKLYSLLLKVQEEMPSLLKDGYNPHFKSKYIKLDTLLDTALPILRKYNILFTSSISKGEDFLIVTLIATELNEYTQTFVPLKGATDMQKLGGAVTYGKRIGLLSLLGLTGDDDDDGNSVASKTSVPYNNYSYNKPKKPIIESSPKMNELKNLFFDNVDVLYTIDKEKANRIEQSFTGNELPIDKIDAMINWINKVTKINDMKGLLNE